MSGLLSLLKAVPTDVVLVVGADRLVALHAGDLGPTVADTGAHTTPSSLPVFI